MESDESKKWDPEESLDTVGTQTSVPVLELGYGRLGWVMLSSYRPE